jgi:uncharacterized membrane protein
MPYCCQCGKSVGNHDAYCGVCGARQAAAASMPPMDYMHGISPRTASLLCYIPILGWIVSIVVLASARFRADGRVRFHAFQGLYLFVAWLMNAWVVRPLCDLSPHLPFDRLVGLVLLIMSIFMMIKASHDETYALPLFGELAQRSVAES